MLKLSKEEQFLVNLLFKEKKINSNEFKSFDFEKLTKVTSSHLLIPALFHKISTKKKLNLIPIDFKIYLEEIFTINCNL